MIPSSLTEFLESRAGLQPSKIPSVLSVFVAVKWATSAVFVLGGIRWRPLKRVFGEGEKRLNKAIIKNRDNEGKLANNLRKFDRSRNAFRGDQEQYHGIEQTSKAWVWMGENYRKYSKVIGDKVSGNALFRKVAKVTNSDPTNLALGVAEGLICYKATFLIHAPLELYLIVKMFQRRKVEDLTIGEEVGREVGELLDAVVTVYEEDETQDKD
mmetsp:Transcript_14104/g.28951  ORF Transcript_14104/g.28951 Transcript_14104/m.28951 type:complete len:212 (-) Transcript_14104:2-637(-)